MKNWIVVIMISLFVGITIISCSDDSNTEPDVNVITFQNTFGGTEFDESNSVSKTADGGYIIIGSTESYGSGSFDVWLIKTDINGNEEWNKTFGGSETEFGKSGIQTNDGGYVITGITTSFGAGESDVYLIKTDSNGNEEWNKTFGGSDSDTGYDVLQTDDGGFIIIGSTSSFGIGKSNVWLIKTDPNGIEEWNKTFGGSEFNDGYSIKQVSDGFIIAGGTNSFGLVNSDAWLIKTDLNGNEEWNKTFGGESSENFVSVNVTRDNGYICTGTCDSGVSDIWLVKTDSLGTEEWSKTHDYTDRDNGNSVAQTTDGGYIIIGSIFSFELGIGYDLCLIKTDANGNEEWNKTFGDTANELGKDVLQSPDGGFVMAGFTASFGEGSYDVWLIKTDEEGNTE